MAGRAAPSARMDFIMTEQAKGEPAPALRRIDHEYSLSLAASWPSMGYRS